MTRVTKKSHPTPRQNKIRGWDWRTKAERLRLAEAARLKLKITRTKFLEQAIDEKLERMQK